MFTDMSIEKRNLEVLNAAASMFDQCQTKKTAPNTPHGQLFTCGKYDKLKRPINDSVLENPKARALFAQKLGCNACEFAKPQQAEDEKSLLNRSLHPRIFEVGSELYLGEYYSQAVFESYKAVKEQMRGITGFETTTEAVGKGGLYFLGAASPSFDLMYQQGAKFTLMAIDSFRNEAGHSMLDIPKNTTGKQFAFSRLVLASVGMGFLDNSEIRA
ncbi:hypothetical protein KDA06_01030 [Candidatus Saccharibacteria bacterium]|jgi:uncharacterized protein (TIGR02391 family)|nr:hypothetical protein [Candidatus Saccharibacteria bacterium]HPR09680.1 TIGR02391 family protein [Candidatus Saccharibacteria bacterium]